MLQRIEQGLPDGVIRRRVTERFQGLHPYRGILVFASRGDQSLAYLLIPPSGLQRFETIEADTGVEAFAILNDVSEYMANASTPESASIVSKRSEEHTSELQSPDHLVCRLLLEKK